MTLTVCVYAELKRISRNFMSGIWLKNHKRSFTAYTLIVLLASIFFFLIESLSAYGVEFYSKGEEPYGIPQEAWMSKWWTWWVTPTIDEATPEPDGCLIHDMGSMVALMDTIVSGSPHQVCEISSNQSIMMIPLWTAFLEDSKSERGDQPYKGYTYEQLSKAAREIADLGAITSLIKIDGSPVANLDVVSSIRGGSLHYKINSMDNITELYSKGFNVTIRYVGK